MLVINNRPGHFYIVAVQPGNEGLPLSWGGSRSDTWEVYYISIRWATLLYDSTEQKKELLPFHPTLPSVLLVLLLCLMLLRLIVSLDLIWWVQFSPLFITVEGLSGHRDLWLSLECCMFELQFWGITDNSRVIGNVSHTHNIVLSKMVKAFSFYKYVTWYSRTGVH